MSFSATISIIALLFLVLLRFSPQLFPVGAETTQGGVKGPGLCLGPGVLDRLRPPSPQVPEPPPPSAARRIDAPPPPTPRAPDPHPPRARPRTERRAVRNAGAIHAPKRLGMHVAQRRRER